jgi:DNA-binding protein YbaB
MNCQDCKHDSGDKFCWIQAPTSANERGCWNYKPKENWEAITKRREKVSKKLSIKGMTGDRVYYITEASKAGTKTSLVVCSDEIKKIDIEKEIIYHFSGGNDVTGDMVFSTINEAVETIEKKLTEDNGVRRIDMS